MVLLSVTVTEVSEMALAGTIKRGDFKTVAEVAAQSGVSPAWLVAMCLKESVPGVTDETSALSPDWSDWVRDRAFQTGSGCEGAHGRHVRTHDVVSMQRVPRPAMVQQPGVFVGRNGQERPCGQEPSDVERMAAKARHLIDGGHYDCAVIALFSTIKNALEHHQPQDAGADVGLIEGVLNADEHETMRKDLHRIRAVANRARHEMAMPSHYDAEKALWVYSWLFGPHGEIGGLSKLPV